MDKTDNASDRTEELDEGQRRMIEAAKELFKADAIMARLKEFDVAAPADKKRK